MSEPCRLCRKPGGWATGGQYFSHDEREDERRCVLEHDFASYTMPSAREMLAADLARLRAVASAIVAALPKCALCQEPAICTTRSGRRPMCARHREETDVDLPHGAALLALVAELGGRA